MFRAGKGAWPAVWEHRRPEANVVHRDMHEGTGRRAEREYLISEYSMDGEGRTRCAKPEKLPCGADGRPCQVVVHEWRKRRCGPGYPLLVVECKTHGMHYTVYPAGWVPYGREPVAPKPAEPRPGAWLGTWFEAGMSMGWRKEYERSGCMRWHTYRRRLVKCGQVLGLSGDICVGEAIAALLEVPLHVHAKARREFVPGTVDGQQAGIAAMLGAHPASVRTWRQVVRAGHAAGLWGRPWFWNGRALEPLFPVSESKCVRTAREAGGTDP